MGRLFWCREAAAKVEDGHGGAVPLARRLCLSVGSGSLTGLGGTV
jgi:hypothetical protein